ncbi:hypothetical protein Tco_0435196 [Tanacetum coccineum]
MQKTILKQNYENFAASSQEELDKIYDRFQKLISQLEVHGEVFSHEDINSSSTNETVNTADSVLAASTKDQASTASYADHVMFSFFSSQSNAPQLDNEDLEQINADDLEKMDLKWQVTMLTMRVKRFIKKIGRKLDLNDKKTVGFDKTKVECYNYHRRGYQMGLESLESRIVVHEKNETIYEEDIAFLKYDVQVKDISIKELKNQLENALKEKDDLKLKLEMFEKSSKNLTNLINSQIITKDKTGLGFDEQVNESEVLDNVFDSRESDRDDNPVNDRFKKVEGYHVVPPPYTGNYMPSRPDLSFAGLDDSVYKTKVSETITNASKTSKDSLEKPKTVRSSALLIEE